MSEAPAVEALRQELGGELPEGVEALDAASLGLFTETLRLARRRQQAQVESALQSALNHLPSLLRGTVRKLFDA